LRVGKRRSKTGQQRSEDGALMKRREKREPGGRREGLGSAVRQE